MTRDDVVTHLNALIAGRARSLPASWQIDEGADGSLAIEVDGARFDVSVRPADEDSVLDTFLDRMTPDERDAFARSLDEAAEQAEREGAVPAVELRRDLDEARARGLKAWKARNGALD